MARFADYFSGASDAYRTFRPDYPPAFFDFLLTIAPANAVVFDIGCGNGQASVSLAERFNKVFASDASEAQIAQSMARPNIQYSVSPAEVIQADDESVDLITVAQAIHWFDHPRFFAEVDRVLKPQGVLAAWGYQLLYSDAALDELVEHFHSQVVGPYWPKGRELLDEGYTQINFPYQRISAPNFRMQQQWRFEHLIGYLNTWSAVKQYQAEKGINPTQVYFEDFLKVWGNPDMIKTIYWPLILYVGVKPDTSTNR